MSAQHTMTPPPNTPPTPQKTNDKAMWAFIIGLMLMGCVIGIFVYYRAGTRSDFIREDLGQMRERGASMDAESCVSWTLDWYLHTCDAVGRMCMEAIPKMVGECLAAQDRAADCDEIGNDLKSTEWAYKHCLALGINQNSDKTAKEACTEAWKSLDTWCKSNQRGVAL